MTTFGDGLYQWGGVPVESGAYRLLQMFESDNIWFVDGDDGLSGNTGKKPGEACDLISTVLAKADFARNATIYVKPRTTSTSAQTYYQDSIDIDRDECNVSIIGCGNTWGNVNANSGVQLKPTTAGAGDHLIDVSGSGLLLENMRLTLSGATADVGKSIVHALNSATRCASGLVLRGCFLENDKSHPGISGSDATAAVAIASATYTRIEGCTFQNCLGGIAMQSVYGSVGRAQFLNNIFAGAPGNRDCDLIISINDASWCTGIVVHGNVFADGVPAHSGGGVTKFINFPYVTAGSGILSNNYFACISKEQDFKEGGTTANIADNFFIAGNWCRGSSNTAPYGIITDA